ncbi:Mu-like prophage DNA circulation protein [Methylomagnum ishizawai]|uniref:Mu-like prophage DNA circulation protein n=1 Tax=Methylomagnum ishizawai TaxID=1760988 RepID=A0A1Y6D302_9GAMM|nr:DNA circularization N-terminal domain-containing protein [Methylomagnum ishizawai]SMF94355.1 Mu-like prophage DNA circulation protein [Methylomagnum ishizawai]
MTWRDQYQTGSFRGVGFGTRAAPLEGGRRVALHEYPFRDLPYPEDLGRKARRYSFEAVLIGADYFAARDALIAALEQRGPGLLVHPYFGRMQVQIERYHCRQSTAEGGTAQFDIEFYEAGAAAQPDATPDTAEAAQSAADDAEARLEAAWPDGWAIDKYPPIQEDAGGIVEDALDGIDTARKAIGTVTTQVNSFVGTVQAIKARVSSLVLAPANLASSLLGVVASVRTLASTPLAALQVYQGLWVYGQSMVDPTGTGKVATAQARNHQALRRLVRTSAAINAARAVADAQVYRYIGPASPIYSATGTQAVQVNGRAVVLAVPDTPGAVPGFASWAEAQAARDAVVDAIATVQMDTDDATYVALSALSSAVVAHVNAQRPALGCGGSYTAGAAQPSLVLAHRVYGDATRSDEIEIRNHIRHPGFVPGGVPIEVIR